VSTLELVESEPPDALTEGDLVDMSPELLESLPPPAGGSWPVSSESMFEEEAPASSQRPRLESSLDELSGESAGADDGRPPLTPPPESGPQVTPPGALFPGAPEVSTLIAESAPLSQASDFGPTLEQIGESVELEERAGPSLELDVAQARPATIPPSEELEALLNQPPSAGIYDDDLLPPPEARDELVAHDRKLQAAKEAQSSLFSDETPAFQSEAPAFPEQVRQHERELQAFPSEAQVAPFVPPSAAEATGMAAPEVFTPALASGGTPELRPPAQTFRPQSFVELLDASLALRG
jgi:hypothetical protein